MKVGNLSYRINIDPRVCGHLINMSIFHVVSQIFTLAEQTDTHASKSFFILVPMVLLYTSFPIQVLCNTKEPMSKFHGLAQITAAFN